MAVQSPGLEGKTRDDAWELVRQNVQNEGLRKHMLAVEAAMRAYAALFGEDVEYWGTLGLIHDWDWEIHPTAEEHPSKGAEMLGEMGWPAPFISSILSHANYSGVPRQSRAEHALFACDELCGLIMATALVKPSKSLNDVEARSVLKKMKDKGFARSVSREDIVAGAEELGRPLEEHVEFVVRALQDVATTLDP